MRKLAVLMLALLVLSGCAMLPVAAAPVPGGRPAGRMENVWYVPNKPVERLEPTQLLETENGIVLWGSGEIVLLDEPFAALDEENRQRMLEYIRKFGADKAVLVATHV